MASWFRKYISKTDTPQAFNNRVYTADDYNDTFKVALKALGWVALRVMKKDSKTMAFIYKKMFWVGYVYMLISAVLTTIKMVQTGIYGSVEEYMVVFRMMPLVGIVVMLLVKAQQIYTYIPVYEDLINDLRNLFPQGQVSDEEHCIISAALTQIYFVIKGYCGCHIFAGIAFVIPGIVGIIVRAFDVDMPKELPYFYWYPFDPMKPVVYELIVFVQGSHTLLAVIFICGGDLLFYILTSHVATQLRLLAVKIRRMIIVPVDEQLVSSYPLGAMAAEVDELDHSSDNDYDEKIVEIIKKHCEIIRLACCLERIVGFSLLFNFLNGTVIICFAGFCGLVVDDITVLKYKLLLTLPLSQLWLICWFGQKLLDSSAEVADALYSCGWYMATKNIKSSILIMLHRSQSNVFVTTYGFSIVCLASYTTVIKTSWSYFTLLLNTYQK